MGHTCLCGDCLDLFFWYLDLCRKEKKTAILISIIKQGLRCDPETKETDNKLNYRGNTFLYRHYFDPLLHQRCIFWGAFFFCQQKFENEIDTVCVVSVII